MFVICKYTCFITLPFIRCSDRLYLIDCRIHVTYLYIYIYFDALFLWFDRSLIVDYLESVSHINKLDKRLIIRYSYLLLYFILSHLIAYQLLIEYSFLYVSNMCVTNIGGLLIVLLLLISSPSLDWLKLSLIHRTEVWFLICVSQILMCY